MVSDFRIKWEIIHYARQNGIYIPDLFKELFDHTGTVSFRRGEQVKFRMKDLLCFVHSGGVLGDLKMANGQKECHLLMGKQIFYTGLKLLGMMDRLECRWTAVKNSEITYIPLDFLLQSLQHKQDKIDALIAHIGEADQSYSRLFHQIQDQPTLEDKLGTMLSLSPEIMSIKQRHLSDYLMVRPPSFSRALKNYEIKHLV